MAFNIRDFRADGLVFGGARPSQFEIELSAPPGIGSGAARKLSLLARAAQIPAMTVDPIEVPYFGRKIKVAGDRTFQDWSVTIMNDEDFVLRSMFEKWSNKINTLVSNRNSFGNRAIDYKVDAIVKQMGKAGPSGDAGVIRSYKFVGLFPTTIDPIQLDWDMTNQFEQFDVTFSYDWWEPVEFGQGETYQATLADDGVSG